MERYYCDNCRKKIDLNKENYVSIRINRDDYNWDLCTKCVNEMETKLNYLMKNYGEPF